jgi:pimeloyl-ACP methyl ester carboxylesterase
MLVLWGMKDFVFDHHFLEEWTRRFPAARVHRFPQAGHYVFEDEADAINDLVSAFIAAEPAIEEHVG